MVSDSATVVDDAGSCASVTRTMNELLPAVVGVPEIVPLLLRNKPAGRLPEDTVQVYGAVPPAASRP